MVTGELRNKIDALWDAFAAGGLVNPLEVIGQVTFLVFILVLSLIPLLLCRRRGEG